MKKRFLLSTVLVCAVVILSLSFGGCTASKAPREYISYTKTIYNEETQQNEVKFLGYLISAGNEIYDSKDVVLPSTFVDANGNTQNIVGLTSNSFYFFKNLETLEIPEGYTVIGTYSFFGCNELKTLILPSTLETISSWSFQDCKSLETVYFRGSREDWEKINISQFGTIRLTETDIQFDYVG